MVSLLIIVTRWNSFQFELYEASQVLTISLLDSLNVRNSRGHTSVYSIDILKVYSMCLPNTFMKYLKKLLYFPSTLKVSGGFRKKLWNNEYLFLLLVNRGLPRVDIRSKVAIILLTFEIVVRLFENARKTILRKKICFFFKFFPYLGK